MHVQEKNLFFSRLSLNKPEHESMSKFSELRVKMEKEFGKYTAKCAMFSCSRMMAYKKIVKSKEYLCPS